MIPQKRKNTIGAKSDTWSDANLIYRLETLFGKAPQYPMALDDYLYHLDSLDLGLPFSFTRLVLINEQVPALREFIVPGKASRTWGLLGSAEDSILVFFDPLLSGRRSVLFCWSFNDSDAAISHATCMLNKYGTGKQGMVISNSPSEDQFVVVIPGYWMSAKK